MTDLIKMAEEQAALEAAAKVAAEVNDAANEAKVKVDCAVVAE